MRTIKKRPPPRTLVMWRQFRLGGADVGAYPFTYDALRQDKTIIKEVENQLVREQGGICAYTGISLKDGFHVEHLLPQTHCANHDDTAYDNMVACWPERRDSLIPAAKSSVHFGAVKKDDWPSPAEWSQFVCPTQANVASRFQFRPTGEIEAANGKDFAARRTIEMLGLDHKELTQRRRNVLIGFLLTPKTQTEKPGIRFSKQLQKLVDLEASLDRGQEVSLKELHFVLRSVLEQKVRAHQDSLPLL